MASRKLDDLGRLGESLVAKLVGGDRTLAQAPFDVVDFGLGMAYEVKTVSSLALAGTNKIHIEQGAWDRKRAFLGQYNLAGLLMVVIIHGPDHVEVYRMELKQHLRISSAIKHGQRVA